MAFLLTKYKILRCSWKMSEPFFAINCEHYIGDKKGDDYVLAGAVVFNGSFKQTILVSEAKGKPQIQLILPPEVQEKNTIKLTQLNSRIKLYYDTK